MTTQNASALTGNDLLQLQNWYNQYRGMGGAGGGYQSQFAPPPLSLDGMNFGFQGTQHQDEGGSYWTPSSGTVEAPDPNDPNYAYSIDPQTGALSHYKIDKGDASFFGGVAKDAGNVILPIAAMYLAGAGLAAAGAGSAAGIGGSGIGAAGAGTAAAMTPADAFALSDSVYGGSGLSAGGLGTDAATGAAGFAGDSTALGYDPGAYGPGTSSVTSGATGAGTGAATGAAGGGTDIFGGNGMATGFTDSGTVGGALDSGYVGGTAGLGGALTGATGLVSPTTGLLSSTGLLSNAGSLLGPAATLLGAAAGAQGQKTSTTDVKDIPSWLKPYVTAPGGVLDSANTLMHQQLASGMPGYTQMQTMGQSLLGNAPAGNGYSLFAAMPRFGR